MYNFRVATLHIQQQILMKRKREFYWSFECIESLGLINFILVDMRLERETITFRKLMNKQRWWQIKRMTINFI